MSFADTLHRAAWRGVPFGVDSSSQAVGRRKVQHDYPYRDTVWLEDQGKLPPRFRMLGFLVSDSAIYGGGDVKSQIKRMQRAAESTGSGILVHPSRGRITVDLLDLVITERWDKGAYAELEFTFVQGGAQVFPAVFAALGDLVGQAASLADVAGLGAFVDAVTAPLRQGLDAATSLAVTAGAWIDQAQSLARDATSLYGTVSQLGGADYGRYFNGRNAGFLNGLSSPYAGASSVADLITIGADKRSAVSVAGIAVTETIGKLGVDSQPADVARSVQAHVAAIQAAFADPSDGIRLLSTLAAFAPAVAPASSVAGVAITDLYRRSAVTALAKVAATYEPSSADDANAVRAQLLAVLQPQIDRAGNQGADATYSALRALRKTVVEDLAQRGGSLARLTEIDLAAPLPAVVIAERQYGDATRAAELIVQADPIHPWFMPTDFSALAS